MPETYLTAFIAILKAAAASPRWYEKLQVAKGKPSKADRDRLIAYCRRIDERRVFSAPFNVEVVECCVASLSQIKEFTDATLANLAHPAAQAVVGAMLDEVRHFLDRWGGYQTPRYPWDIAPPSYRREGEEFTAFFQDLGELRAKMRLFVGMLEELEPRAQATRLLGHDGEDAEQ